MSQSFSHVQRLPIVGVMGSGRSRWEPRSSDLGAWLAELGVHLLTGGGSGVMAAVSEAFSGVSPRTGRIIGILPAGKSDSAPPGYPNPWVEIVIRTHLPFSGARGRDPLSRNHVNILSSDVIVALPGSLGTSSEVQLALEYGRPIIGMLEERNEIPQLPASVAIGGLREVQEFVQARLKAVYPDLSRS